MTEHNAAYVMKKPVHPDQYEAVVEAAREVLKLCFSPKFGWTHKSANGIPMGISGRQQRAVKKLAALYGQYSDYDTEHNEV